MAGYLPINHGGSGGGGTLNVPSDQVFATTAERDTYFTNNPEKLVDGAQCIILNNPPEGMYQVYTSGAWEDRTAVIQGPQGPQGPQGDKGEKGDKGDPGSGGGIDPRDGFELKPNADITLAPESALEQKFTDGSTTTIYVGNEAAVVFGTEDVPTNFKAQYRPEIRLSEEINGNRTQFMAFHSDVVLEPKNIDFPGSEYVNSMEGANKDYYFEGSISSQYIMFAGSAYEEGARFRVNNLQSERNQKPIEVQFEATHYHPSYYVQTACEFEFHDGKWRPVTSYGITVVGNDESYNLASQIKPGSGVEFSVGLDHALTISAFGGEDSPTGLKFIELANSYRDFSSEAWATAVDDFASGDDIAYFFLQGRGSEFSGLPQSLNLDPDAIYYIVTDVMHGPQGAGFGQRLSLTSSTDDKNTNRTIQRGGTTFAEAVNNWSIASLVADQITFDEDEDQKIRSIVAGTNVAGSIDDQGNLTLSATGGASGGVSQQEFDEYKQATDQTIGTLENTISSLTDTINTLQSVVDNAFSSHDLTYSDDTLTSTMTAIGGSTSAKSVTIHEGPNTTVPDTFNVYFGWTNHERLDEDSIKENINNPSFGARSQETQKANVLTDSYDSNRNTSDYKYLYIAYPKYVIDKQGELLLVQTIQGVPPGEWPGESTEIDGIPYTVLRSEYANNENEVNMGLRL